MIGFIISLGTIMLIIITFSLTITNSHIARFEEKNTLINNEK